MAHRFAYELWVAEIPEGYTIDHVRSRGCQNIDCVRPEHLEAVPHAENLRRGRGWGGLNAQKTHCPRNHPYSPENTYTPPTGGRLCRTCHRERERERYQARRPV